MRDALNKMFVCNDQNSDKWNRTHFNSAGKDKEYSFTVPLLRYTYKDKGPKSLRVIARKLRRKIQRAVEVLEEVKEEAFAAFNNVIIGRKNRLEDGDDNFVIGNYNKFSG